MSTSNGSDSAPNLRILSPLTEDIHNRASEDNLREDEPDDDRPQARTLQEARAQKDPWAPIVLSLDGGGIKGLSELFILLKIMDEISSLIRVESNPEDAALFAFLNDPTLLPCYFFDFMVGTSTGGLIAVMLGRLRMSIPDAIKAYWCFGNDIFRPRRFIRSYSSTKLKDAVVRVIRSNCGCHVTGTGCCDMEPLRQYDFVEKDDLSYRGRNGWRNLNFTCKTALVAQRKEKGAQVTHLFRSYNHTQRFEGDLRELNPRTIGRYNLRIWQACRASSAAPLYFKKMKIDPDEFLDGGVGNNNPSDIAWFEAKLMLKPLLGSRTTPDNRKVAAMLRHTSSMTLGAHIADPSETSEPRSSLLFQLHAQNYPGSQAFTRNL
ncbi:hypothetical protein QQX98_001310 [Neonectria punicea]|uniref:PNPLA domain-containing protein n=1 Tax=Neonectria punicea TaxID=979145 RepID=A0ABR1HQ72_9HYPO